TLLFLSNKSGPAPCLRTFLHSGANPRLQFIRVSSFAFLALSLKDRYAQIRRIRKIRQIRVSQ
ncbi:MAG: hypothetical protein ABJC26_17545, partial [Gemmatimonadaceae bacterium]